jgi:hypothetical protein
MQGMHTWFPVSLACGAALLAGCSVHIGSGKAVDKNKVEQEVSTELTKSVGQKPKSITCPGDLKAKVGTTMRCKLTASDGSTIGLTLRVTSVKGSDVEFHIQVDKK